MTRAGSRRWAGPRVLAPRCIAVVLGASLLATACAASAQLTAPPVAPVVADAQVDATPEPATSPTPPPTRPPTVTPAPTATPEPVVATTQLRQAIDANFAALDDLGVTYSFAVHAEGAGYIEERHGKTELLPASNQKVVTAVGALELLDHDFRFVTELRMDADRNVYVVGGGDPTFRTRNVKGFALRLQEALSVELAEDEVATIGDVIVDASYFPPTRTGPGWPARYVPADIGPMSAFWLDDNQFRGDAAYVSNPELGNAQRVMEILEDEGIVVGGRARVGTAGEGAVLVAERRSPDLLTLVDTLLGRSDNETAEALLRQIGLQDGGAGEIPEGQAAIYRRLAEMGVDLGDPVGDGSGLSRQNRLSAAQLVEVLRLARSQEWWSIVNDGLASAGLDGTLRRRLASESTAGNVRAKTGTLGDARSLSGVLNTADGQSLTFGFVINGEQAPETVEEMDRIIVAFATGELDQLEPTEDEPS